MKHSTPPGSVLHKEAHAKKARIADAEVPMKPSKVKGKKSASRAPPPREPSKRGAKELAVM